MAAPRADLLAARPWQEGVELMYSTPQPGTMEVLSLDKVALGGHLSGPPYVLAVVGQRVLWHHPDADRPVRYFVALDTWRGPAWDEALAQLVTFKDRYLATWGFAAPVDPASLQALRGRDGLLAYRRRPIGTYRHDHPYFVGTDHLLRLTWRKPPSPEEVAGQVASWVAQPVVDPTGRFPLMDPHGKPLAQVQLPANLPNDELVADLRLGRAEGLEALWQVLGGLLHTRFGPDLHPPDAPRQGNAFTGY